MDKLINANKFLNRVEELYREEGWNVHAKLISFLDLERMIAQETDVGQALLDALRKKE